jgi:hypothetical protein
MAAQYLRTRRSASSVDLSCSSSCGSCGLANVQCQWEARTFGGISIDRKDRGLLCMYMTGSDDEHMVFPTPRFRQPLPKSYALRG